MSRNKLIYGVFFLLTFIIVLFFAFTNTDEPKFDIGPSQITLQEGDTFDLQTTLSEGLNANTITLVASNTSLVSVDGLTLTALNEGIVQIQASIEGSDSEVLITLEILKQNPPSETMVQITFEDDILDPLSLKEGEEVVLPVLEIEGYLFDGWMNQEGEMLSNSLIVDENMTLSPILNKTIDTLLFDQPDIALFVSETSDYLVLVTPLDYDVLDLTYEVANEEIASIDDNGRLLALNPGFTTITVTDQYSGLSSTVELMVEAVQQDVFFTVTFETDGGSSITPVTIEAGHRLNLENTPEKEGYVFKHWILERDTTHDKVITNDDFIYRPMTLRAVWGLDTYTIKTINGDITKEIVDSDNPYFQYELLNEDGSFFAFGITNPSELQALAMNLSYSAVLMNDISLPDPSSTFYPGLGELGDVMMAVSELGFQDYRRFDPVATNFFPIGHIDNHYLGSIYGNGFTISNLRIKTDIFYSDLFYSENAQIYESGYGLLGYAYSSAENPAEISYLTFENAYIETRFNSDENTGILAGALRGENYQVSHILVKDNSTIYGKYDMGGIIGDVGSDHSTFTAITNYADIYVTNGVDGGNIGGIVGYHDARFTNFTDIKNYGDVTGRSDVGGFIGDLELSDNIFINIENHGDITSSSGDTGGIIGYLDGDRITLRYVTNTGIVRGRDETGGIIGEIDEGDDTHLFEYLYNYSDVIGVTGQAIGGIIGYVESSEDSYNNVFRYFYNYGDVSGPKSNVGGIIGDLEYTYNFLFEYFYNYGSVTGEDDLGGIFGDFAGEDHVLNHLYNYGTISGILAGESNFGGIIGDLESGDDHTFSNLFNYGTILGYRDSGGLVGEFDADDVLFENSQNFGRIEGTNNVGGIIGYLYEDDIIFLNITNSGLIIGSEDNIGGIIGEVESGWGWDTHLTNVSNLANVSGNSNVGGIIGYLADSEDMTFTNIVNDGDITSVLDGAGGIFGNGKLIDSEFNMIVNNGTIYANGNAGGLFGVLEGDNISASALTNYGNVSLVAFEGNLFQNVGGIVGDLASGENQTFNGLINYGSINGTRDTGGLFGDVSGDGSAKYLTLKDSHNYGAVLGTDHVGGIFGAIYDEYVTLSGITNQGEISGIDEVGGLIGIMDDSNLFIYNSTNASILDGLNAVGGLIGSMDDDGLVLENVDSSTTINGSSSLGGLMGYAGISDLIVSGASILSSIDSSNSGESDIGGVIGYLNGHISSSGVTINVNITAVSSTGVGGYIGVMDGFGATFDHSSIEGTIDAYENVGGLIGKFERVSGSSIDVTIRNHDISIAIDSDGLSVGGYIGRYIDDVGTLNIISSNFSGTLMALGDVGGFVGTLEGNSNVSALTMTGEAASGEDTSGFGNHVGGLFGYAKGNNHRIEQFTFNGLLRGNSYIGGMIGSFIPNSALVISNTISGTIEATNFSLGGAFGLLSGGAIQIETLSNTGQMNGIDTPIVIQAAGLIGTATVSEQLTIAAITMRMLKTVGGSYASGFVGSMNGNISIMDSTNETVITEAALSGGFMGEHQNGLLTIENSVNLGDISGYDQLGGFVGSIINNGQFTISNSTNQAIISGETEIGGFVGSITNTSLTHQITHSFNTGQLSSSVTESQIGGFIGESSGDVTLQNLVNAASITGFDQVGGLVGMHSLGDLSLTQLTNAGVISGFEKVGGIVGDINMSTAIFDFLSNTSEVKGYSNHIGGLFGYLDIHNLEIRESLNTGNVFFDDTYNTSGSAIGGLVGFASSTFRLEFDNNVVSTSAITGTTEVGGIVGYVDISSYTANALFITNNAISGTILASTVGERGALYGKVLISNDIINESSNNTSNATLLPAS